MNFVENNLKTYFPLATYGTQRNVARYYFALTLFK